MFYIHNDSYRFPVSIFCGRKFIGYTRMASLRDGENIEDLAGQLECSVQDLSFYNRNTNRCFCYRDSCNDCCLKTILKTAGEKHV